MSGQLTRAALDQLERYVARRVELEGTLGPVVHAVDVPGAQGLADLTVAHLLALLPLARQAVEAAEAEAVRMAAYLERARPRLAAIDLLASRIDFSLSSWRLTPEGERYERLMREQGTDEMIMGI